MRKILTILLLTRSLFLFAQIDFLPYQTWPVGSWPEVVETGDVNNDGRNDVVLGTTFSSDPINDNKLFVFIQNSQGVLTPPVKYSYTDIGFELRAIAIADVNNDSLNDIIIGFGDSLGVFFQNPSGTLDAIQRFYSGTYVEGVKCGDLNNDGLIDIACAHGSNSYLRVFYQCSTGFISASFPIPSGGFKELEIGDLNGDGLNDVCGLAGFGLGSIHVYTQNTSGTLNSYVSYSLPASTWNSLHGIAIGDLNNDGLNDVVASKGGNTPNAKIVQWFQDTITGLLKTPPVEISAFDIPEPIMIADLNCDNKNEIITVHGGWMKTSVFEQDTSGLYNSYVKYSVPYASHYNPYGLSVNDINGDGMCDIAIADYNAGLVLLVNNSKPTYYTQFNTIINPDTIFHNVFTSTSYYSISTMHDNNRYRVVVIDSFAIINSFVEDSIRVDSLIITGGQVCSKNFYDTTSFSIVYYAVDLISTDTIHLSTRIDTINLIQDFHIYPNPSTGVFTIDLPDPFDLPGLKLLIYNDLGKLIHGETYPERSNQRRLDIGNYPNGLYVLSFKTETSKTSNKRIIKTR